MLLYKIKDQSQQPSLDIYLLICIKNSNHAVSQGYHTSKYTLVLKNQHATSMPPAWRQHALSCSDTELCSPQYWLENQQYVNPTSQNNSIELCMSVYTGITFMCS